MTAGKVPEAAAQEGGRAAFRRTPIGWGLAVFNGLMAIVSMLFFLAQLKVGVVAWLMINTCAPSALFFTGAFVARSLTAMVAAAVLLLRYGINGLIASGWTPITAGAQCGHILMVLGGVYVVAAVLRARAWRALGIGLLVGIAVLVPYTIVQHMWSEAHPELLRRYLSGELLQAAQ